MKRAVLLTVSAAFLSLFAIAGISYATSEGGWSSNGIVSENVGLKKGETHNGSLYLAGSNIEVNGDVNGDLYCAGQYVKISGNVSGDVLCAGQSITVTGTVSDSARLAAQEIVLENNIGGDVSTFAQNVTVAKTATIAGDLNGASQKVTLNGIVEKNFRFGAERLQFDGTVRGVSDLSFQTFDNASQGTFVGTLSYEAPKMLDLSPRAESSVNYNQLSNDKKASLTSSEAMLGVLLVATSMLLFALAVTLFAPRFLERSRAIAVKDQFTNVLVGISFVFAVPFVSVLLLLSVVGIPLSVFLSVSWVLVLMLSGPFFAYFVGSTILRSSPNVIARMLMGSIVLLILYAIPVVNILVMVVAAIVGSGIVLRGLTAGYQRPLYNVATATKTVSKTNKK